MRRTLAWTVAAVATCIVAVDAAGIGEMAAPLPLRIRIALQFLDRAPSGLMVAHLKLETEEIWRPYGVQVSWDDPVTDATFEVVVEAHQELGLPSQAIGPLGTTRITLRGLDHVPIRIFSEPTERILDGLSVSERIRALGHPRISNEELGRALGRILAHEVGHVLLAAPYHQRSGLMRPAFTGVELIVRHRDFYRLSEVEVQRLASINWSRGSRKSMSSIFNR